MSKNQQGIFWATVALAMVVISAWVIKTQISRHTVAGTVAVIHAAMSRNTANISNSAEAAPVPTATATPPAVSTTTQPTTTVQTYRRKTPPKPMPSYGDMITQYQNTRIQFDSSCHGIPSRMAVANPVTIMLDNRSAVTQKIVIAGKTYNVAGYNYVIVTIKEKTLPESLFVNCNNSVNVTEIILE